MRGPSTKYKNLEEMLRASGSAVKLLKSSPQGPHVFPGIPAEFTNWRDEQRAWRNSVALLEVSYHMTNLYIKGSGAKALFSKVAANKIGSFPLNRGKQLIATSPDGYLISDGICFHTSDDVYRVVGGPTISDWVQFNVETGDFDVEIDRDESISRRGGQPRLYGYQVQGPNALPLMLDVTEGTLPDIGFFGIGEFTIKGRPVRALRHGMAGEPGFEIFGPWEDQPIIMEALMAAGQKYDLRKVGAATYPTSAVESGWIPSPVPGIYHSEEMKPFREWLTPMHRAAGGSLGGSMDSEDIQDYYMDPIEVGYGAFIDFDQDFIGRDALAEKIKNPKRKKVTLVWNQDDVMNVVRDSLYRTDTPAKYLTWPLSIYAAYQYDEIVKDGRRAGVAHYTGFSANAQEMLSLSLVDIDLSEPGTEVTLRWGEPNSRRPLVEKNVVHDIRAKVATAPYFQKKIKKN